MKNKQSSPFWLLAIFLVPSFLFADWTTDVLPYTEEFVTVLFNTLGNQIVLLIVGIIIVTGAMMSRSAGNWMPLIYSFIASAAVVLGTSLNVMHNYTETLRTLFS